MGNPAVNDGSVHSILLDGSLPQVVLSKGQIHTSKQLALDDVNDKLYIADREATWTAQGLRLWCKQETLTTSWTPAFKPSGA